ncbi:hypothetical protein MPP7335_05558 [Mycolicibacterium parafortuitum]|uniref:Uncharacterized protein n=1 Tax=Mycolicibacterium parafortuitum TaxID=39692 RepID=A0A375YRJ8_MYCPF|nr:hypothetical protein MPP7335_01348 [Mycolicibacterium parafortuitum]SRX83775.1 hypothetical protein MPP7335_05558 [Mycolicibacterium parafortuitum]
MFGIGVAFDRQAVCSERRRANGGDTGKGGQDLTVGLGEQCPDFDVEGIDIGSQPPVSVQIAAEAQGALVGIGRRRQTSAPPMKPVLGGAGRQAPLGPGRVSLTV